MAVIRPEKQEKVKILKEKINHSKALVVVDFKGLSVKDTTKLRNKLKQNNAYLEVVKNTMFEIAAKESGIDNVENLFKEQSAVVWDNESVTLGAKIVYEFSKDNENLKIKGGILEGKIIDFEKVKHLATLPSKEILLGQLLSTMQAPVKNLLSVLNAPVRDLILVLKAIQEKQL